MKAVIGELYKYPKGGNSYKLISITGFVYRFDCGHWVTGNVFADLVRVKTGIQVYKDRQLELIF
jgi:hypothetical protein